MKNIRFKNSLVAFVSIGLVHFTGAQASARSLPQAPPAPLTDSVLVEAAKAEIADSETNGGTDTQCSDYVAKVIRRAGVQIPAFHSNDFDKVAVTWLPDWHATDFVANDLKQARIDLRAYLNSYPDHTAFIAQWVRNGQSGHVAILEKVAADSFLIYQAQANLTLPHVSPAKIESLLYGTVGVDRSHIRVFSN